MQILYDKKGKHKHVFFKLPEDVVIIPGPDEVWDLNGNLKYVSLGQLMAFQVTEEQVYRILEENWRLALQETKNAWSSLKKFTHLTELENDSEAGLKELLKEMSDELPVGENFSIESLFPETEVQEINQKANDLIKEIMGDVFADLPQDPENLEAWSQDLHRRFFAEEIDRKEKKRQQELKESIGNSIARRLRERGVTPSQDFDQS